MIPKYRNLASILFFLLYLKKVKVFHNFSCVFEKNIVPLQRILIEGIQCREKNYIVEF